MRKSNTGRFMFLCFVLLLSMTACQKETPYLKDVYLGMPRDEILEIKKEWGDPKVLEEDYICYQDIKFNDLIGEAEYNFDKDGKLIQSNITIVSADKESPKVYEKLVKELSREYGEASKLYESTTMWKTERNGEENYILCLHDSTNKNLTIILCTPEVYDGIINFKPVIAEPYTFDGKANVSVDNRTLVLEDTPENIAEEIVFKDFLYTITGEFDAKADILAPIKSHKISIRNQKKRCKEDICMKSYIIHEISTLSEKEYGERDLESGERNPLYYFRWEELVEEYNLIEYKIIHVNFTQTHSEKAIKQGPQWGDGTYSRSFLVGRTSEDDTYKIFDFGRM